MSKCKLIINRLSGNAHGFMETVETEALLKEKYDVVDTIVIDHSHDVKMRDEIKGYDALAACGGDGTLNSAINAVKGTDVELIYIPCGTLNDTAKSLRLAKELSKSDKRIRRVDLGQIGDVRFAYVFAGGTFTSIGYETKIKNKKHFKMLAYLFMVFKTYKVHRIKAKVTLNDKVLDDEFTLIMAINCSRCFGFKFNKRFSHNDGRGQLLLIKSPKHDGFLGKVEIFFPFFRAFFMGFKREKDGKKLKFLDFSNAKIELANETAFTVDGEKLVLGGEKELSILKQKLNLVTY